MQAIVNSSIVFCLYMTLWNRKNSSNSFDFHNDGVYFVEANHFSAFNISKYFIEFFLSKLV